MTEAEKRAWFTETIALGMSMTPDGEQFFKDNAPELVKHSEGLADIMKEAATKVLKGMHRDKITPELQAAVFRLFVDNLTGDQLDDKVQMALVYAIHIFDLWCKDVNENGLKEPPKEEPKDAPEEFSQDLRHDYSKEERPGSSLFDRY